MEERLKAMETELAYLRRTIEELIKAKPIELHEHYHYDYSNMQPIIIKDGNDLKGFFNQMEGEE